MRSAVAIATGSILMGGQGKCLQNGRKRSDLEPSQGPFSQEPSDEVSTALNEQSKDKECKKDEYKWRLTHLLGSEQAETQEYHSDSNSTESVCTEDFAMKFKQGMIEPIGSHGNNEDHIVSTSEYSYRQLSIPDKPQNAGLTDPLSKGNDHISLNTARREDILQQFKEELHDDLQAALSFSEVHKSDVCCRKRRDSLESLGGQISRLSQANISEHSSLLSLGKGSSIESHLSSKSAGNHQTTGFSLKEDLFSSSPAFCSVNTLEHGSTSMANLQEMKTESQDTASEVHVGDRSLDYYEERKNTKHIKIPGQIMEDPKRELFPKYTISDENKDGRKVLSSLIPNDEHSRTLLPPDSADLIGCNKMQSKLEKSAEYPKSSQETSRKHSLSIPLKSFDAVTVDSDLDTVSTERVRDHIRKVVGSRKDPARNTKRIQRNYNDFLRYSVSTDDEDEDAYQKSFTEWRNGSPMRWNSSPPKAAEYSWGQSVSSLPTGLMSSPDHVRHKALKGLSREKALLEESIIKLRRDIALEEDLLAERKSQHQEVNQSVNEGLQQKKEVYLELESLQDLLDRTQKEVVKMESQLRENQITKEEFRDELVLLEYKRKEYLKQLRDIELELNTAKQKCSNAQNHQIAELQYEISSLTRERDELKLRLRHLEGSLSFLELQELERQLTSTKSELFSEQHSSRIRMEKLKENLEESQCKLDNKTAECLQVQEKNKQLKSQLRELEKKYETQIQNQAEEAIEQKEALNQQVTNLTSQSKEQNTKVAALEKILSEKELDLMKLREVIARLNAEKEAQALSTESMKEEHNKRVMELQLQHQQDKEMQIVKLKEELQCQKQKEMQQFAESMEHVKIKALQDQAESIGKETEKAVIALEAKDKEIAKLKEALKSQKDSMKKLAVEMKQEAREMVHNTVLREQKKWENEKNDALQIQRHTMEEEKLQNMADLRESLEKERRAYMMLEKKLADLQNIIQEHEIQYRLLQREKQDALDELRSVLKEENQEEIKRLHQELGEERERDIERLKLRLQQLEEEHHILRAEKNEAMFREREALTQAERADRAVAREISAACEHIQNAVGRPRILQASHSRHGSPSRLSTNQALQNLHEVCEETNQFMHELQQEIEAQKRTALHVQREKERELQQQKEQLQLEKDKALELMKERLIQEHIEEITNLQRDQLRDSSGGESLRQQLREKDNELRAIQRNMGKWKDETATKLARKFEEELNIELEKSLSRSKASESHRYTELSDSRRLSAQEGRAYSHTRSASSPSLNVVGAQHDFGALKILRNLQGRVRELRTENRAYHGGSMEDLNDLGNSYKPKRPLLTERSMSHLKGNMRK
ncbi:hypothetical protein GDO86_002122 [Hymenochirus boettgeri]|uniref:Uncharacterized protein n=1 Tax=Hymenochirus boettgeri TaxID=247094 RepID=A0A8T2KP94_9PIPI|nr:hypothetical protein GDO86_002122 [Hymenochirus boettgeri]